MNEPEIGRRVLRIRNHNPPFLPKKVNDTKMWAIIEIYDQNNFLT